MNWLALGCAAFVAVIAATAVRAARQPCKQAGDEHADWLGADAGGSFHGKGK
ncbi:hypothetical protein [Sphingomonas koreensis]